PLKGTKVCAESCQRKFNVSSTQGRDGAALGRCGGGGALTRRACVGGILRVQDNDVRRRSRPTAREAADRKRTRLLRWFDGRQGQVQQACEGARIPGRLDLDVVVEIAIDVARAVSAPGARTGAPRITRLFAARPGPDPARRAQ